MAKLLDVNLPVAILHAEHEFAPLAQRWLETQTGYGSLLLCRVTQMGVLRLLTRRAMMRDRVLSGGEAWGYWRKLLSDDPFGWWSSRQALMTSGRDSVPTSRRALAWTRTPTSPPSPSRAAIPSQRSIAAS